MLPHSNDNILTKELCQRYALLNSIRSFLLLNSENKILRFVLCGISNQMFNIKITSFLAALCKVIL